MPTLELISHVLCPYVQRAAIVLYEKDAVFDRTVVDLANKPAWFNRISPLGKVPLLRVEDKHVLFESAAICEYLDETIAPRLHPDSPLRRAQHRAYIEFASSLLNDIWQLYTAEQYEAFERKRQDIASKLATIEANLEAGPFFSGSRMSLVDAAFAPVFRYFDVFESFVTFGIFADMPKLNRWRTALRERRSVQKAVTPTYAKELLSYVRRQKGYLGRLIAEAA